MFSDLSSLYECFAVDVLRGLECLKVLLGANPDNLDTVKMINMWCVAND